MSTKLLKIMDKKTITYVAIGLGAIILLIIFLLILKISVGSRINSKQFENKLIVSAKKYYDKYPDKLPSINNEKTSVTIDELIKSGTLQSPDKLLNKGLTCTGKVNVNKNNDDYMYQPDIKCSDKYETNFLYKKIIKENVVTTGNGLYNINGEYIFRGDNINNLVKFGEKNWRIVKINKDNTIRLILDDNLQPVVWDDRYNVERKDSVGKNDYAISRIKDILNNYYNSEEILKKKDKSYVITKDLCIGSRNENSKVNDGSLECSKKIENEPFGLLQANEYMLASLESTCKNLDDKQCKNYNYLGTFNNYWTLTSNTKNSYEVYRISGRVESAITYLYAQPRIVVTVSSDILFTNGNGTKTNPYKIK